MSVAKESANDTPSEGAPQVQMDNPSPKRRVLFYAAAPVVLLIVLMTGVRFVTDAAQKIEAGAEEKNREELRAMRPNDPAARPTPVPVVTYTADAKTQTDLEIVVQGQLKAIADEDYEKALTYAISDIRRGSQPAQFGSMIRSAYAPMLAAKKVTISPAKIRGKPGTIRQAFLEAEIQTEAGGIARYGYILMSGADGWQVAGVMPDRGAMAADREENVAPMPRRDTRENFRDL
ncbi:MAG: DUF4864 domain-containing protein [Akkermansiaceae bacterium]|nr:DUF4864 domain-containing protein [Armatimonadota bacterium]